MDDQEQIFPSSSPASHLTYGPPSSPLGPPTSTTSRKIRKPPPITPKRFTRFFTPRSSVSTRSSVGRSGRQLRDITRDALNRRAGSSSNSTPRKTVLFADAPDECIPDAVTPQVGSGRKRKGAYLSPESSPIQPSPSKRRRAVTPTIDILEDEEAASDAETVIAEEEAVPEPIVRPKAAGFNRRILQRSFGGAPCIGRGRARDHCVTWRAQVADFYSEPDDAHHLPNNTLPFCTTPCNTNSLIAIGDEEGWVRLLDTAKDAAPGFTAEHLSFRAHANAVMDLAFSSDDLLLATASGDQTAQIMDVRSQQPIYVLAKHSSSVKQVRFQPGNDHVLATSSRDGTVQLWDLRCSGGAVAALRTSPADTIRYASTFNTLASAHAYCSRSGVVTQAVDAVKSSEGNSKAEIPPRRGDASVTALAFLSAGRDNLLLTASDASSCVKLWDIRGRYSRRGPALPISTTRQPESHNKHRQFGINSLTLSGDGGRFYALSRDNTVYAYSTNHLVLGHCAELSNNPSRHRYTSSGKEGLGPLYGFRHPKFHATSFYVKSSLRPASGTQPELLAVGSSNGCPIVFPTDEAFLKRGAAYAPPEHVENGFTGRPGLRRSTSSSSSRFAGRMTDTIPIYEMGAALVRGHQQQREVTSVTWTHGGDLVSVSDDYTARCWREDAGVARDLRLGGEAEGRRWGCGWAEVAGDWDELE